MPAQHGSGGAELDDVARALTNLARRWMLIALADQELCAAELCALLGFERHSVSKHLKVLKECGFIQERPDDRRKMLSLNSGIEVWHQSGVASVTGRATDGGEVTMRFALPEVVEDRFARFLRSPFRATARRE